MKPVAKLSLIVEDYDGIASTQGSTLRLSTRYLKGQADRGVDLRQEIIGILHFGTSLVFQSSGSAADVAPPGWLMVGIADYVRLESGYIDRSERAKGGSYDGSGSQTTAFFLDYLVTKEPTLVMQLNQHLAPTSPAWSNDVFQTLLGSDLDTLGGVPNHPLSSAKGAKAARHATSGARTKDPQALIREAPGVY